MTKELYMKRQDVHEWDLPCPVCGKIMQHVTVYGYDNYDDRIDWCPVCGTVGDWDDTQDVYYVSFSVPESAIYKFGDRAREVREKFKKG